MTGMPPLYIPVYGTYVPTLRTYITTKVKYICTGTVRVHGIPLYVSLSYLLYTVIVQLLQLRRGSRTCSKNLDKYICTSHFDGCRNAFNSFVGRADFSSMGFMEGEPVSIHLYSGLRIRSNFGRIRIQQIEF